MAHSPDLKVRCPQDVLTLESLAAITYRWTELQIAVAGFINNHFQPSTPIGPECILTTNGVSSLAEQVVGFNLCDAGDGVMLMTPTYMMFPHNLCTRAGLELVTVPTDDADDPDFDAFATGSAPKLVAKLEAAYVTAQQRRIRTRVLLLCNPCNPVGRSYSSATLLAIARFCGRHEIHMVADEIYAMSSFPSPDGDLDVFSSVLAIADDPSNKVYKENIHAMYGASKDWACGGLRLGFLITRNPLLWRTCRRLALSTWTTTFSTAFFTHLLSDAKAVDEYLDRYRLRLRESYLKISTLLRSNGIPFRPANSGLFVFIELTKWLVYFDKALVEEREAALCRYLIEAGLFLSQGRVGLTPGIYKVTRLICTQFSLSTIPGCFRFVYARDPAVIDVAVSRLSKALAQLESLPVAISGNLQTQTNAYDMLSKASTGGSIDWYKEVNHTSREVRKSKRSMATRLLQRIFCS